MWIAVVWIGFRSTWMMAVIDVKSGVVVLLLGVPRWARVGQVHKATNSYG